VRSIWNRLNASLRSILLLGVESQFHLSDHRHHYLLYSSRNSKECLFFCNRLSSKFQKQDISLGTLNSSGMQSYSSLRTTTRSDRNLYKKYIVYRDRFVALVRFVARLFATNNAVHRHHCHHHFHQQYQQRENRSIPEIGKLFRLTSCFDICILSCLDFISVHFVHFLCL